MTIPVVGMLVSGSIFVLLAILFRIEQKRGRRFFESGRSLLDASAAYLAHWFRRRMSFMERTVLHQTFRYFLHQFLSAILRLLGACSAYIQSLQRSNKIIAKRIYEEGRTRTIFDEIREHKEAMTLTPRERKKAKEKSIGGRL